MSSSRGLSSAIRFLHNGKGRPLASYSSTRQPSVKGLRTSPFLSKRPEISSISRTSPLYSFAASQRFASTVAPSDNIVPSSTPSPQPTDAWDASFDDFSASAMVVEPYIGFLKSFGLDFGLGPSSMVQWLLEHIHVYSGLPWFGSIIATVLLGRIAIFKLNLNGADSAGRMAVLQGEMAPIQAKMRDAQASGDRNAAIMATQELRSLYKAGGVNPLKIFLPIALQIPLGFGTWRVTRAMAAAPIPGLENGGAAWFTDLTLSDPYFILPIATGALTALTFKRGGEMGSTTQMNQGMRQVMQYLLPCLSVIIMAWQPGATQIVFFTASLWAYFQSYLLSSNKVRAWANIQPLPPKGQRGQKAKSNYQGTISMYKAPSGSYTVDGAAGEPVQGGGFGNISKVFKESKEKALKYMHLRQQRQIDAARKRRAKQYEDKRRTEIEESRRNR